ncbi:Protein tyrosine kinase [Rhizoctonia solani]|uniref:non-specific serine/threonine protein kinase n=1 Tax=Rhizoctonia solani TaxID=456999 RepID=A0A8H7M5J5_9AGAM|nr:Protein tyrosine kinase [Rhizoctonia solani]
MAGSLLHVVDSLRETVTDAVFALSSCMCRQSATIKVNGRSFVVKRVLGEGGFSFVYLVEDATSGRLFALKKIRCPTGEDGVREAMREVEGVQALQDHDEGKIVYLFLPFYQRGNLQDAITSHSLAGTHFGELELAQLFRGTCLAVRAMHAYRAPARIGDQSSGAPPRRPSPAPGHGDEADDHHAALLPQADHGDDSDDEHGGGYSYSSQPLRSAPPRSRDPVGDDSRLVFDGDAELGEIEARAGEQGVPEGEGVIVPYAHRDIKPANVMYADDGVTPILMDFGSTIRARIKIEDRSQALVQQDLAAEQSTMPYRAPELFDVKTGTTLTEAVDIWSLGCTLFALARMAIRPLKPRKRWEQGGSMAMAVMGGKYKHPPEAVGRWSAGLIGLIDACLKVDPSERPDIHQLIAMTDKVIAGLR